MGLATYATFRFYGAFVGVKVLRREASRKHALTRRWFFPAAISTGRYRPSHGLPVRSLGPVFSAAGHLHLLYQEHSQSSEVPDEVDRTQWHALFRSFSNVKTLLVAGGFERELSRFLRLDDGESPMQLFPELNELSVPPRADVGDAFASFIDARRNTHRPVTLVHRKINVVVILR